MLALWSTGKLLVGQHNASYSSEHKLLESAWPFERHRAVQGPSLWPCTTEIDLVPILLPPVLGKHELARRCSGGSKAEAACTEVGHDIDSFISDRQKIQGELT